MNRPSKALNLGNGNGYSNPILCLICFLVAFAHRSLRAPPQYRHHGNVGYEHEWWNGEHVHGKRRPEPVLPTEDVLGRRWFGNSTSYNRKCVQQAPLSAKVRSFDSFGRGGLICVRISAALRGDTAPTKPTAFLTSSMATMAACYREVTYSTIPVALGSKISYSTPSLGRVLLVSAELVGIIVLCFYALHPNDEWQREDIGYRTGFIACAQLPLVFLLAGKNNIIGLLAGASYERLNWLHRWTARVLFLTVTIHMGFWFADWYRFDYIKVKLTNDPITQRGFAAWVIMLWIVISSMAPLRKWNYEFFVLQHIVSFSGLIAAIYLHLPAENKMWIWIPVGLLVLDRTLRWTVVFYTNLAIFHPNAKSRGALCCRARFEPLDCETTRITVMKPPLNWSPGQHVLLSCHMVAPLQSHPFTIASIPSDGKLEFLIKSRLGGTKRYLEYAEKQQNLPLLEHGHDLGQYSTVLIEGPYGRMRPFRQFDSVFLIAGSSGGTFTIPLLRDIVHAWDTTKAEASSRWSLSGLQGAATKYMRFVWVVKSHAQYNWFADQLLAVAQDVERLRERGHDYELDISIYVTCDEDFVARRNPGSQAKKCGIVHGLPEEAPLSKPSLQEDEKVKVGPISIESGSSGLIGEMSTIPSCGPNGTCCCQTTIEDEHAISNIDAKAQCCCGESVPQATEESSDTLAEPVSSTVQSGKPSTPRTQIEAKVTSPLINVFSGRPQPINLIRKMLEQALGESAVAVCGPQGLVSNVRQSVVSLSDERAIHKGTGAQGIYLHTEAFEY